MGNRGGPLHNNEREIVRTYKSKCWLTCRLEFNGRHRIVMSPRRYTELFFLDEAVAFAAGHRPCAECRRGRYKAFKDAWRRRTQSNTRDLRASEIDAELHRARIDERRKKLTYESPLGSLPTGCFVEIDSAAYLIWGQALLLWTPERYAQSRRWVNDLIVTVLTPRPIVECFGQGYEPEIHASARDLDMLHSASPIR